MSELAVKLVDVLGLVLYVAMIGRVLMSWINVGRDSPLYPIATIIYQVTEPILAPLRRILPSFGMLDFSPMAALLLIYLGGFVLRSLVA